MRKVILMLLLVYGYSIQAQTNDLNQEQIESFKARCEETIEAFQYGLEIIGDKSQDKAVKEHYKQNILSFSLVKGNHTQILMVTCILP